MAMAKEEEEINQPKQRISIYNNNATTIPNRPIGRPKLRRQGNRPEYVVTDPML